MSLVTYTSAVTHLDDATFRAWGLQLSNALQACGLVKTTDTGQIDWATVVRPGVNNNAGYEIYRFSDPMQATKPIFFKVYYGTATSASIPRIQIEVGTGSNGAGTVTGVICNTFMVSRASGGYGSTAPTRVFFSVDLGLFWLGWNLGGLGATVGALLCFIERAKDDDGVVTGDAVYMGHSASTGTVGAGVYSYQTTVVPVLGVTGIGCMVPGNIGSTTVGPDVQVYRHYMSAPRLRSSHLLTYLGPEFADFSTIEVTNYDGVARDYMPLGLYGGQIWVGSGTGSANHRLMVPLE